MPLEPGDIVTTGTPAGVVHGAWTDQSEMRAFVVEFAGPDDVAARGILEGMAAARLADGEAPERGEGTLQPSERDPESLDRSSGEPL